MRVSYDHEAGVLHFDTGIPSGVGATLLDDHGVVIGVTPDDGYDIAWLTVMGASAYLPLDIGYDAGADTLQLGRVVSDADLITENGDLTAYWHASDIAPDECYDAVGVAIRNASVHFANMIVLSCESVIH